MLYDSSLLLAVTIATAAFATAAAIPVNHAVDIALASFGMLGGMIVQLWTIRKRRPPKEVIAADLLASGVCGYTVNAVGVPWILNAINKFWSVDIPTNPENHLGVAVVLAIGMGMVGAQYIRTKLFKWFPELDGTDGTRTP